MLASDETLTLSYAPSQALNECARVDYAESRSLAKPQPGKARFACRVWHRTLTRPSTWGPTNAVRSSRGEDLGILDAEFVASG
jgi:hypothetical protein